MNLKNKGSLITYELDGDEHLLGYLMNFKEHGIHSADFGVVDITPEEMEIHNKLLSEAEIKGLDENCEIGYGGCFYFGNDKVTTFNGSLVSDNVHLTAGKKWITFLRNGKQYRGRLKEDEDLFNFKRIS